ncbi:acetolactate synthase large subunit [Neobacillus sp. FSL H8-0543]|uniref:acetolactate synthase large subunit n=1 Tax=Neobacillus sp. FSL H8-0543 TaxID=2954672 RepID=UPI00315894A7
MKVTDVLVQCLENEGVEYIFGIVGTETLDLADSLSKSKQIQYVNVRHEQGAAFMADVYGRLSNKVGVCLSTLGPGATNLLTAVASAQLDHSPVVALIGQAGVERQHPESHQYIDIVKTFEPATKWSTQIMEAQTLPATIRKAFRTAKMEKPGAVALTLPENLAAQMIPDTVMQVTPIPETVPAMETLQAAAALFQKYLKPFIIIGNGVIRKDAVNELQTFIEKINSPATHSFMAKGVLPKEHPLNYFTFGFNENDLVLSGIKEADLLIVIGYDFVEKLPKDWNQRKTPILHIDSLPAEVNEYYPVESELVGNIKQTLMLLNQQEIPEKSWVPTGNLHEKIKLAYQIEATPNDASTLTIESTLQIVEKLSTAETIVISDVGAHKLAIARTFQPKEPNRVIISNGLASMGIALPGSIGAKLARPDAAVICITGDGGLLMNVAEIETAKRLGLSFIIVVLNDSMLRLEVETMNKRFGESFGVTFQNPDFIQLAESFGIKGRRAANVVEFESILQGALETSGEIVLIDVSL